MRAWFVAMIALGCLAAAGCHAGKKYAALALEDENRQLEDMIYQQQAELERQAQALEACQAENQALRERGASEPKRVVVPAVPASPVSPGGPGAPDISRPSVSVELPSAPSTEVPESLRVPQTQRDSEAPRFKRPEAVPQPLQGPSLEVPAKPGGAPEVVIPEPLSNPAGKSPPQLLPGPAAEPSPTPAPAPAPAGDVRGGQGSAESPDSSQVAEVTLNEPLTGGSQTDPERGDRGITLVLEPRDARGRLVPVAAPVAIVVVDPSLQGAAGRVARWDFTAEQVASLYRKAHWGEGFHLEMLWPGTPPVHEKLVLFVRYTTSDGRKLETRQTIRVAVAGSSRQRTNTAEGWQHRPTPATAAAPSEPLRVSSRTPAPTASAPARPARPVWSPERP